MDGGVKEVEKPEKFFLSADSILSIDDLGHDEVYIPKWDTWVRVRGMTAGERTQYSLMMTDGDVPKDAQAQMVAMCAMDENGNRLFTAAQVPQLSQKSSEALQPLSEAVMRLSGMLDPETAEKN